MSVVVVTGPPCGGKSTYVVRRAHRGDVVIDLDVIALALTTPGVPDHAYSAWVAHVAIGARYGAISRALSLDPRIGVWIIHTSPPPRDLAVYRVAGARVVTVNSGKAVCLDRAAAMRPQAIPGIAAWYARRSGRSGSQDADTAQWDGVA